MKIIKIDSIACMSCIIMNNIFEKIKEKYVFDLIEYDFDEDNDDVLKYNVKTLPTYIFYESDKEISRLVGENSIDKFEEVLKGCEKK